MMLIIISSLPSREMLLQQQTVLLLHRDQRVRAEDEVEGVAGRKDLVVARVEAELALPTHLRRTGTVHNLWVPINRLSQIVPIIQTGPTDQENLAVQEKANAVFAGPMLRQVIAPVNLIVRINMLGKAIPRKHHVPSFREAYLVFLARTVLICIRSLGPLLLLRPKEKRQLRSRGEEIVIKVEKGRSQRPQPFA